MALTISERLQNGEIIYLNPTVIDKLAVHSILFVGTILLSTQLRNLVLNIGLVLSSVIIPFSYFSFIHNKKYITKEGAQVFSTWVFWKDVEKIEYHRGNESSTSLTFIIHTATTTVTISIRALFDEEMTEFFNSLPQLKFVEPSDWRFEFGEWVKK